MSPIANSSVLELPPRARRIQVKPFFPRLRVGTTSACAENTSLHLQPWPAARNYLRVRGEYLLQSHFAKINVELPPRARRIPAKSSSRNGSNGTTSACAENTKPAPPRACSSGNYLRVRGEYWIGHYKYRPWSELPPRARRIPALELQIQALHGTTSACAENTHSSGERREDRGNYLRVRGEYPMQNLPHCDAQELPPRARRIRDAALVP